MVVLLRSMVVPLRSMVVSDSQQHLFSKFLVIDDKGWEEKKIKAYLFVCGGETGLTSFSNWSDRFVLSTPKILCIQLSFILEICWEIWICNNYLLNLIYVLDLRTLVLCATMCVMYSKCSKWLNVSLCCMFVWWMSCSLSFYCFVG
jgi:hypothetical protein